MTGETADYVLRIAKVGTALTIDVEGRAIGGVGVGEESPLNFDGLLIKLKEADRKVRDTFVEKADKIEGMGRDEQYGFYLGRILTPYCSALVKPLPEGTVLELHIKVPREFQSPIERREGN